MSTVNIGTNRKRSRSTSTPSTTLISGLMKYPRLASRTRSVVTTHMNAIQLVANKEAVRAYIRKSRGRATNARSLGSDPLIICQPTNNAAAAAARHKITSNSGTSPSIRQ